jgi:L-lactate dehydrogenase
MKVGIVGAGLVGATAAYALIMRGLGRSLVLVDLNRQRAEAEADDLLHAVPFAHPLTVAAGDYPDLAGSRLVIIAAGANQKPGETRLQLLGRNALIFRDVVANILQHAPEAVLAVATNPVDVMTHLTAHYAGRHGAPSSRVIGSGTMLDTARFRALLGLHLGVDPQHVHAYVLGEHGDSEVLTWSLATVGGVPLEAFCAQRDLVLDDTLRQDIDQRVRRAAYHIIGGKGATYYGIGSALARLAAVILGDQRAILTVCTPLPAVGGVPDVTVSLPHLVGGAGILDTFPPALNPAETGALRHSAGLIREAIAGLAPLGVLA